MSSTDKIYQIKVTLRDTSPPIWRRLLIPADTTLFDLHKIIQIAMGWTNSHLHQFIIDGKFYSIPFEEFMKAVNDPCHKEHESYVEWWGGPYDPESLDLDDINLGLKDLDQIDLWDEDL